MNPSFLQEMPKFKTPDEELNYLREHVKKREAELIDIGHTERTGEMATRDVIDEYKKVPLEKAVHSSNVLKEQETEGIVLRLKPEPHDTVMEELLGIVITKGVRNALSIVESMGNPHIEDDFHRLLVQYFKTGQIAGFKEGNTLYRRRKTRRTSPRASKSSSARWSSFMPACSPYRKASITTRRIISLWKWRSAARATKWLSMPVYPTNTYHSSKNRYWLFITMPNS